MPVFKNLPAAEQFSFFLFFPKLLIHVLLLLIPSAFFNRLDGQKNEYRNKRQVIYDRRGV